VLQRIIFILKLTKKEYLYMFTVHVTIVAPNYDTIKEGVYSISREVKIPALLPLGSVHYFRVPKKTFASDEDPTEVIAAELGEYLWFEGSVRVEGIIRANYRAQSISPRGFQGLSKRKGFSEMGWTATESSL
jgi:hypothetical protein